MTLKRTPDRRQQDTDRGCGSSPHCYGNCSGGANCPRRNWKRRVGLDHAACFCTRVSSRRCLTLRRVGRLTFSRLSSSLIAARSPAPAPWTEARTGRKKGRGRRSPVKVCGILFRLEPPAFELVQTARPTVTVLGRDRWANKPAGRGGCRPPHPRPKSPFTISCTDSWHRFVSHETESPYVSATRTHQCLRELSAPVHRRE